MNRLSAVLFDRDGTLVVDVPYNGDPDRVRLMPGAAAAVALARSAGLATGVVSNQSGVGRGLLTVDQVVRVNERADELLGGLDTWVFCPHGPDAGCACRKPRPGLVRTAAARLGVPPAECLVIGDIAADVLAARAAGARGVLVPNAATAPAEVERFAMESAPDPLTAVRAALTEAGLAPPRRPPHTPPARTAPAAGGMRWSREGTAVVSEGRWSSVRNAANPAGTRPPSGRAAPASGARRSAAPGEAAVEGSLSSAPGEAARRESLSSVPEEAVRVEAVPGEAVSHRTSSSAPGEAAPGESPWSVPGEAVRVEAAPGEAAAHRAWPSVSGAVPPGGVRAFGRWPA
ncbi:HAD-IIIA family hydrolase [Streptomyces sp. NPDC047841]|uniref:D-glycero-alpha-D-manno-heptose-1,7-bisphosphate 7-phosphatase n=1 Tax=Streptomyces sp. NPDC047841 TaxID=3154708 RepID=UPI0034537668